MTSHLLYLRSGLFGGTELLKSNLLLLKINSVEPFRGWSKLSTEHLLLLLQQLKT
jgi:hypothetical protein